RGKPTFGGLFRLVRYLRKIQPDVVQTWLYHADLLGLIGASIAQTRPVVWNIRSADMDMRQYPRLSSVVVKLCALLSAAPAAVVVNSATGRTFHAQIGYQPRRWAQIPNGIDTQKFKPDPSARITVRQELCITDDAFLIGLIARWDPMKDHATFIRAAGQLATQLENVYFVLAGQDVTQDNRELRKLIAQTNLAGKIFLLGKRTDIPRILASLDLLTSSSVSEGFPNVVVEAMACSIPCVVTNVGDSAEIVAESGWVVPIRDPDALVSAWQRVSALDDLQRQQLGHLARQRATELFSLRKMIEAYEAFYLEMAKFGAEKPNCVADVP
ncbi:MAG: glycosyltransferase, partial [Chloroflexi bacterium]|nr:glycosyltransferase [Chloroflexota bacterium]